MHMRPAKPVKKDAGAGTKTPKARVGECALLKAVTVTRTGAFMDCGLDRDLLVPVSQQLTPMVAGQSYVVYLFLDPMQNVIGTTKLHKFLDECAGDMTPGQAVDLLIVAESELGYKAVINGTHLGLLYRGEVFTPLRPGDRTGGYIKTIRADRKIDLCLQKQNKAARDDLSERIIALLESSGGVSTLTDYSPPELIYKQFGVSKKNYKKALGRLYKERRISLEKDRIRLLQA
jgi:predicted RNA-binding protein (virulence factor B family)